MLTVERSWLGHVKRTSVDIGIVWIVEPESHMESVDRVGIALVGIESEDLIEQDRLDRGCEQSLAVDLKI